MNTTPVLADLAARGRRHWPLLALAAANTVTAAVVAQAWRRDVRLRRFVLAIDDALDDAVDDLGTVTHAAADIVEDLAVLRLALNEYMPVVVDAPAAATLAGVMTRRVDPRDV